jgi:thiol-disulfide isomerase/thioredoxin
MSCNDKPEVKETTLNVMITAHKTIDSILVYDKEEGWEVIATLNFAESNQLMTTLPISKEKIYQLYVFNQNKQKPLGELLITPKRTLSFSFDETNPYNTIAHKGTNSGINNFLSFIKKNEESLAQKVMKGMDTLLLSNAITMSRSNMLSEANTLKINDTITTNELEKFDDFSEILKAKNKKYIYKASLSGKMGNDFNLRDITNDAINLKKYLGSYVYIDVWATWCKPCKTEYPFLKQLEEKFAGHKNFNVVSISMDQNVEQWEKYVLKNKMTGAHYHTDPKSDFISFYDIGALPRFILLKPDGTIISPDTVRPSEAETEAFIEQFLKADQAS